MQNVSSGNVTSLQKFLINQGYLSSTPNEVFDIATENAVKAFQKENKLDQSGEVDDMTQTAMLATQKQGGAISGKAAQAAWISIANAGYGGPLTKAALANPSNSPSGIQSSMQAEIDKQVADSQFASTNKYNANGGVIGNEKCLDKEGRIKKIDPTDPTTAYCDNVATSGTDSAAKIKADIDAARQSPYLSILATAQNTNNASTTKCSEKDTLCKINNTTGKIGKYASLLSSILSIGTSDNNGYNPQYSQLSNAISDLIGSDKKAQEVSDQADQSKLDYAISSGPTSEINDTINRYKDINAFNVEKLNNMVYTYFFMQKAGIVKGEIIAKILSSNATFLLDSNSLAIADNNVRAESTQKLITISSTLQKEIQDLIKQMAANNLKVQQLTTVLKQIKDSKTENISSTLISNLLKNTLTDKNLEDATIDYNYMEEYQDATNLDQESIRFIIPTKSETTEPGIKNNLMSLRIKSYKIAKGISYSIPGDYTPNLPKNFQYAINSSESQKYKEVDYCNKIANDICKP
jgi:peptidoglycan hydrolase-like protein with peptidoglycan-binding domain